MTDKELNKICQQFRHAGVTQRNEEAKRKRAITISRTKETNSRRISVIKSLGFSPTVGYIKTDKDGNEYVSYPKNSKAERFWKRQTSKRARKTDLPREGNGYRRCLDYWWKLY